MQIRLTFLLLIIFLLGSCTIEKRLYNRGWHVEFRKNTHRSEKQTVAETDAPQAISAVPGKENDTTTASISVAPLSNQSSDETTVVKQPVEKRGNPINMQQQRKWLRVHVQSAANNQHKKIAKRWSQDDKRASMILVGILLVLGIVAVIAIVFQLQAAATFGEFIGFLFLVFLLGIMTIILLFVLIAMSFTSSTEQARRNELEKEKEKKNKEDMSTEEQYRYEKQEKSQGRDGKAAAIFVAIVLVLILGVAFL